MAWRACDSDVVAQRFRGADARQPMAVAVSPCQTLGVASNEDEAVIHFSEAVAHAHSWIVAWNAHDLEGILDHYAHDVELQAQTVVGRWGRADGRLRGTSELRQHFSRGLQLAPNLRFDLEEVFTCPGGYAVLYRRENGNRVIDAVVLNSEGKAKDVRAFYVSAQA